MDTKQRILDYLVRSGRVKEAAEAEKYVDYLASRVSPLMAEGAPSFDSAVAEAYHELEQTGRLADSLHGSGFREE